MSQILRLPRYTSYPTAAEFQPLASSVHSGWIENLPIGQAGSLYLHVPFCPQMCWYCGCHTFVPGREDAVTEYADSLIAEIALIAAKIPGKASINQIHFGGGSPGWLSPDALGKIMSNIRSCFTITPEAEIAIELDPRRYDANRIAAYASEGFNRFSLGVQEANLEVQQAIGRVQPFAMVHEMTTALRQFAPRSISFDVLYGLPKQTLQSLNETMQQIIEVSPDRLSVFSYAHMPRLKPHQHKISQENLPNSDEKIAQFEFIRSSLVQAGYQLIGMDHFAKSTDAMAIAASNNQLHRNFQGYVSQKPSWLLGIGCSAISDLPMGYAQNSPKLGDYQRAIANRELATARGFVLSPIDLEKRRFIMDIMCQQQLTVTPELVALPDWPECRERLDGLVRDGVLDYKNGIYHLMPNVPIMRVRQFAACLDASAHDDNSRYSDVA